MRKSDADWRRDRDFFNLIVQPVLSELFSLGVEFVRGKLDAAGGGRAERCGELSIVDLEEQLRKQFDAGNAFEVTNPAPGPLSQTMPASKLHRQRQQALSRRYWTRARKLHWSGKLLYTRPASSQTFLVSTIKMVIPTTTIFTTATGTQSRGALKNRQGIAAW